MSSLPCPSDASRSKGSTPTSRSKAPPRRAQRWSSASATSSCTRGRLPEARRHLERAIASDPRFGPAHAALSHAAVRQGRWEEARSEVALAFAADPTDAVALFRYAELLVGETSARGEVLSVEREAEAVVDPRACPDPGPPARRCLRAAGPPPPATLRRAHCAGRGGARPRSRARRPGPHPGLALRAQERLRGCALDAPAYGRAGPRRREPLPQRASPLPAGDVHGRHGGSEGHAARAGLPAAGRAALRRGRGRRPADAWKRRPPPASSCTAATGASSRGRSRAARKASR